MDAEEVRKAPGYRKELYLFLVCEVPNNLFPLWINPLYLVDGKTRGMFLLNGVVAMDLDSTSHEGEPSTPLRDPASSPAIHIQWQNSQSACAAMEELRVASSMPRRRKLDSRLHDRFVILIYISTETSHLRFRAPRINGRTIFFTHLPSRLRSLPLIPNARTIRPTAHS